LEEAYMNITNKYCRLSELTQAQIDELKGLMPDSPYGYRYHDHTLIGFTTNGNAGLWSRDPSDEIITYKEMLSLFGAKEEQLVPHVHQKEIIAWANGEEIEYYNPCTNTWLPKGNRLRETLMQYRVKPKLTPTQLRIKELKEEIKKYEEQDAVECGIDKVMGT
tara:strand:+ start:13 stop:501 length:489 start_codon:yes stop_codon:yes gene_type:complete